MKWNSQVNIVFGSVAWLQRRYSARAGMLLTEQSRTRFLLRFFSGAIEIGGELIGPTLSQETPIPSGEAGGTPSRSKGMGYHIAARRDPDIMIIRKENLSAGPKNDRPWECTSAPGPALQMRNANPAN